MAKAKIDIAHCGECRPHYERVEMIQRLQSAVEDRFIFLQHDRQGMD